MRTAKAATLSFVPDVLFTSGGTTWVQSAGRVWEVTQWLPGRADFRDRPTPERMEAACAALAQLHQIWAAARPDRGPCPAVQRRLDRHQFWSGLVRSGWRPLDLARPDDVLCPWAARAWHALLPRMEDVPRLLAPWEGRAFPLQPCLCDVWHDHVLFEHDTVTGLIDYGAAKYDLVAVDLARLLGSLAGDDAALRGAGLRCYTSHRPLTLEEEALITALDRTGVLVGAANWLIWAYHENRPFPNRSAVVARLACLVKRMESW
jgi:Ser/Thr protein kinase RdoA (MazF antagonist)